MRAPWACAASSAASPTRRSARIAAWQPDTLWLLADLIEPGLTVIRQDVAAIGAEAARLLFARLDGDTSPVQHVVVPHRLVQRGSGEIRPRVRG